MSYWFCQPNCGNGFGANVEHKATQLKKILLIFKGNYTFFLKGDKV